MLPNVTAYRIRLGGVKTLRFAMNTIPLSDLSRSNCKSIVLNEQNAQRESEHFINQIPQYRGQFAGRGIVIAAGGLRYFSSAWVCIRMLRSLECSLPIELWHYGPEEIDAKMKSEIESLGVICIDATQVPTPFEVHKLRGYGVKPFALLHTKFKEVLLLDADNVPIVNPEYLFDTHQFKDAGAIFWPDYGRYSEEHQIWELTGVEYRDEPEFESGQILIDKEKTWRALCLALWYNQHSDLYYKYILGDKDTFHMAFRKLQQQYAMPTTPIFTLDSTMCQHDFEGRRIFQHRNYDKWYLFGDNKSIPGFVFEARCREFLDELRNIFKDHWGWMRLNLAAKSPRVQRTAHRVAKSRFIYRRVGYDERPMSFLLNGVIAEGHAGCEMFWDLRQTGEDISLVISSDRKVTCELRERSGCWHGRWLDHERMPIELLPLVGAGTMARPDVPSRKGD